MRKLLMYIVSGVILIAGLFAALIPSCSRSKDAPGIQYVDREVIREIPMPVVRIEKRIDTVHDIHVVHNSTDRYFYEKAMKQIDSLYALIRERAQERRDTVERIYRADTLLCVDNACDTISLSFLALSERLALYHRPSARQVKIVERSVMVPVEVFPVAKKLEWASYGAGVGVVGVLVAQALTREK